MRFSGYMIALAISGTLLYTNTEIYAQNEIQDSNVILKCTHRKGSTPLDVTIFDTGSFLMKRPKALTGTRLRTPVYYKFLGKIIGNDGKLLVVAQEISKNEVRSDIRVFAGFELTKKQSGSEINVLQATKYHSYGGDVLAISRYCSNFEEFSDNFELLPRHTLPKELLKKVDEIEAYIDMKWETLTAEMPDRT